MQNDTPKTTIYLQAIITTDAVPDFSFFNQLSNVKVQAAPSQETPTLLENVVEETNKPKPKFSGEREGDPNKPITGPQIGLVKKIIEKGKFDLPEILEAYHVSELSKLSDADVQSILKASKKADAKNL